VDGTLEVVVATSRIVRRPEEILRLTPDEADAFLDRLEQLVPARPPLVALPGVGVEEAIVFGDTHGDWRTTEALEQRYRESDECLVGLGDYIDRPPADCGEGSVANVLFLLSLAAERPGRVFLLQGNHETVRRIPALPHTLAEEVDQLWGPESSRYERILGLLERGPLAATTPSGAYLAHAGFPRGRLPTPWTEAFSSLDDERLIEIVWSECDRSRLWRGAVPPWNEREFDEFLQVTGLTVFLRGHDPDVTGRPQYGGRCLTLHTCRIYERFGGVIVGHLPLARRLDSVLQVRVEHLPTEHRTFRRPE
jgi:Calcineurin-like phosphoesterase